MLENISKGVETVTKLSNMQDSAEKLYSKTYNTMDIPSGIQVLGYFL